MERGKVWARAVRRDLDSRGARYAPCKNTNILRQVATRTKQLAKKELWNENEDSLRATKEMQAAAETGNKNAHAIVDGANAQMKSRLALACTHIASCLGKKTHTQDP